MWIPHQAADEYLRNRLGRIEQRNEAYPKLREELTQAQKNVEKQMNELHRDSVPEVKELLQKVQETFGALFASIEDPKSNQIEASNSPENDEVWKDLTELFSGKVGDPYSTERGQEISREGERRYENKIPPGYKDARKGGDQQYGDLILWLQVIDKAKEIGKPIVFVTDDRKEDWWLIFKGKTIGPLPELVDEIRREANVLFHMYTPDRFMSWAASNLQQSISQEAIGEVQELRSRADIELESVTPWEVAMEWLVPDMEVLTADERLVVSMYFYEDLDTQEIAEQLARSRRWVSRTLHRAMNKMQSRSGVQRWAKMDDFKETVMEAIQAEWDKLGTDVVGRNTTSKQVYDRLVAEGLEVPEGAMAETLEELKYEGRISGKGYHDRDAVPIHGAWVIMEPGRVLRSR